MDRDASRRISSTCPPTTSVTSSVSTLTADSNTNSTATSTDRSATTVSTTRQDSVSTHYRDNEVHRLLNATRNDVISTTYASPCQQGKVGTLSGGRVSSLFRKGVVARCQDV